MPTEITKTIVILANSRKLSGRCIAGRELPQDGKPGVWVRPVSDRPSEEVSEHERQYEDGSDPRLLDVVDVPLLSHCPHGYQSENWLLDPESYWCKSAHFHWSNLDELVDPVQELWPGGFSTYHGCNDRVPQAEVENISDSLRLVKLDSLTLSVFAPGRNFDNNKRKIQARFTYCNQLYRLRVTDPLYERKYLQLEDGEYKLGPCYVTVSLGEPYEGYCYKLVAAIMEQDGLS